MAVRYELLEQNEKNSFEKRLLHKWNEIYGLYGDENLLAPITKELFNYFSNDIKKEFLQICIDLIISSRYVNDAKYLQMEMANHLLKNNSNSNILMESFKKHLFADLTLWDSNDLLLNENIEDKLKSKHFTYRNLNKYFRDLNDVLRDYLLEWESHKAK